MKLNRRSFLKLTGAVMASLAVPSIADSEKLLSSKTESSLPEFDPNKQYGDYICLSYHNDESVKFAKTLLVNQIRASIPPKYCNKKYIKFIEKPPGYGGSADPLNQVSSIGWKYTPKNWRRNHE